MPPHPWNVDFPHLMLRAKATQHAQAGRSACATRLLAATDTVGSARRHSGGRRSSSTPSTDSEPARALLEKTLGVARDAPLPQLPLAHRARPAAASAAPLAGRGADGGRRAAATAETTGQVALFTTCYGNRNEPDSR